MQGKWMYKEVYKNIKDIKEFEKKQVTLKLNGKNISCYRYRTPFYLFKVPVGVIEIVFTEEAVTGDAERLMTYIMIIGAVFFIVGVAVTVFLTKGIVNPIQRLRSGMRLISKGKIDTIIEIRRHDEIGDLNTEFNKMIGHLKDKLELSKHVSSATASRISNGNKKGKLEVGSGERKNYVFLFSDVRGFTSMSEKMKPAEVVEVLNEYLNLQTTIIHRNKGDIDKFVGDEIMAFFEGRGKVNNAIQSAVEIITKMSELNLEREQEGLKTIEVGIGIHMGDVIHGRIGSQNRMDDTSIGDTVNLSARLCSSALPSQILISEIVKKAITKKFKIRKMDPIFVKGKKDVIRIYEVKA
jgi:adenylate cyclase